MTTDDEWIGQAACRAADPELFFPERGGRTAAAKAICRRCPVAAACLETALTAGEYGIWGGTSETERRTRRRRGAA